MKVCQLCGEEIGTRDGENLCASCESASDEKRASQLKKAKANRRARDAAMLSVGMKKVRGAMGGTYWE